MKCNVTRFEKRERENELPYFVIKAVGIEGDETADVLDEEGCINPFACMSRRYNFTKTLFPGTTEQCDKVEKLFKTDDEGNVLEGKPIRLMAYHWAAPQPFYIRKDDAATGVYETEEEVTVNEVRGGKTIAVKKTKYVPKVFTEVNLTLFETKDGKSAEGDADQLCKSTFERGVANGSYILCDGATGIVEVTV